MSDYYTEEDFTHSFFVRYVSREILSLLEEIGFKFDGRNGVVLFYLTEGGLARIKNGSKSRIDVTRDTPFSLRSKIEKSMRRV